VTHEGLRQLLQHEAHETFRFLTREVDVTDLARLPWYERHPRSLWRFFLAVAFRLSPWRRVLFAAAAIALALGWIGFLGHLLSVGPFSLEPLANVRSWLLLAATVFFFLLTLELRDKLSLKGDLEVARQIQFGLLPSSPTRRTESRSSAPCARRTRWGRLLRHHRARGETPRHRGGRRGGQGMPAALLMASSRAASARCCPRACAAGSSSRSSTPTSARTSPRTD